MKPAPFAYRRPDSLEAALELLAEHGDEAKILAGGQSLIPVMNFRLAQPAMLIDVNRLTDLDRVEPLAGGGLRLGALTRQSRLEREPAVAERAPLLAEAVPLVAHPQIRNRGTLGGSLAHADPAAELPAVMVALDAGFHLARRGGERRVAASGFFQGLFATALEPEEMLVAVDLPPRPERSGAAFVELSRRHGDYAMAGVAATVDLDAAGRCTAARLVFMSVGEVPVDSPAAAGLTGEVPAAAAIEEVATAAAGELRPTADIHASAEYRRHLAAVLARRALTQAVERAAAGGGR